MNLLKNLIKLTSEWDFYSHPTFCRAQDLSIGSLCSPFPHTLTSIISFISNSDQHEDWSRFYYFFSRNKWKVQDLFSPCIEECLGFFDKSPYIVAAMDDSLLKKTGKKIKTARWLRDPMSPPFHPNLIWALRFIQVSLTLPLYHFDKSQAPRGIPVHFKEAPTVKKPKKKASQEEWKAFKEAKKKTNISLQLKEVLRAFREELNAKNQAKDLLVTVDGAACNRNFLGGEEVKGTVTVARCRSDIKLCLKTKHPKNKQHFYDKEHSFIPESIYKDKKIPWKKALIFRAQRFRWIEYKEVSQLFWPSILKKKPIKLIVLKRIPYHPRKGHVSFRDPAYLLCMDPHVDSKIIIQAYHDHPQIELNIKEEKSVIGVGKAQVKNDKSVERQPAFSVASYAALLVASLSSPHLDVRLPPWREKVKRVGVGLLIKELKKELLLQFFVVEHYKPPPRILEMLLKKAA